MQNHLNSLHGVFSYSIKRGWAATKPVAHVDRPKKTRSASPHSLPVSRSRAHRSRQGEPQALKWMDVDWVAGRVRVTDSFTRGRMDSPKSHQGRSVPMADRLAGELERYRGCSRYPHEEDLVFCHPATGNVQDPSKLRKRFREALQRAEVRAITFLRHPFGTQLAAAGVPLRALQ